MMKRILTITLISITADIAYTEERDIREHQGPQICGGRLDGPVGIIQTPNFPNPFPVPIKCRWIIEHDIVNGTISIYFTQQYTTTGLTFTEYMYYDESYKLGERKALTVTEENITRNNWLQVQSPVLVVELTLNRLEGTQLRALGLLSVFGFNMTYMVKGPTDEPGPKSCSTIECRLLGHCYAKHDYKEFYCDCFEGYSGADCGVGPLCPKTPNMCKNGGTCGQMGPAAVNCICAAGFTGDLCESQIKAPECGIEECTEGCKAGACDCNPKDSDVSSARFETRLQIIHQENINISQEIIKQISNYLRACNITLHDEIEILNISIPEATGVRTVWLQMWAERRDAGPLRTALARLVAMSTRTDRLHLLPVTMHFVMQPALSLHALIINQRQEVWEGSEFLLSCMAYGSPDITFTWFKDGVKVNFNGTTRDIWTRIVAEDALGRRMSVLGISKAKKPDSGRWSCSATDAGRKRCSALRLTILRPPDIRLVPSSLTVNKGDNVSITCLADAGRMHGMLGFSWTREQSLLPQVPGRELWEDLYPAGSVLKLYNVQKSGEFRCHLVSSVAGKNMKGVIMWALGPKDEACESEASHGLRWPKTFPGSHASATCPRGHNGESVRFCEPKTIQHGVKWMVPDFSGCVANSLNDIYEQFTKISYGYSWGNISHVAHQYRAVLRSIPTQPGEGTLPLKHARNMLHYLLSNVGKPRDRRESVEYLLIIYDTLLKYPDSFLDEEKIYELQNALVDTAAMRDSLDNLYQEFSVKTKQVREDGEAHFNFISNPGSKKWWLASAGVELMGMNRMSYMSNMSVVVVQYRDLTARLPSLRRSLEFNQLGSRTGQDIQYQLASAQTQVTVSRTSHAAHAATTLLFVHSRNYTATATKLACALRTASEPSVWMTTACEVRIPEPTHVTCRCRGLGTFALFTVARTSLTDAEKDLRGIVKVTVVVSGALCLVAAALQLLSLMPGRRAWLPVLMKAVTAGTHSAAVLTLLECDTTQEEACPGALGWLCAVCWCVGCAALCAAPLLLQAELAGRRQGAPSVGLLAGVCILALLTARLFGGAPLQIGAEAQTVCAVGCAMLTVLCFVLAVCAALRLRNIKHKSPTERRTYLRDRRVVYHTLAVLATTSAVQAVGVWWAQPGPRTLKHVLALSAAALVNGITMLVCYVIRDEECLQSAKRILSLPSHRDWRESPVGDTSLNFYIKQGGELESRGDVGILESTSSQVSPVTSYWRAPGLESPARIHRRQSTPDTRADIVRCVEYKDALLSPRRYDVNVGGPHLGDSHMGTAHVSVTHAVCDLIAHSHTAPQRPNYMTHMCLELGVLRTPPEPASSLLTSPVDFRPYIGQHFDTSKDGCSNSAHSNPDVSKISSPPIKSCLKQPKQDFISSISLPSMESKEELNPRSDIDQVNRKWNKEYVAPKTDIMLNKISNDLDFLLNRNQNKNIVLGQIKEAPT